VTAGLRGWQVSNVQPPSYYFGGGGTHNLPDDAYVVAGPWRNDFEVDAGTESLIYAHCNVNGCNRWDSGYDLFLLDSAVGLDLENYNPQSSTVAWSMRGTNYSFSPTAFTAGTINVGTLNATTITGGVSGSAINSGTVSAARLPLFGPSGTTHAPGIVPDPGATAGATRYLREDGTWDVPAGGSGGGSGGSPTGTAGGDLAGSYPNPTVAAVHATGGTLDGVTIGAATPAAGSFSGATVASAGNAEVHVVTASASGYAFMQFGNDGGDKWQFALGGSSAGGIYANNWYLYNNNTHNTTMLADSTNDAVTFVGTVASASYMGPATAPTGACSIHGAWVFSQDGHATFCASGTWITKI